MTELELGEEFDIHVGGVDLLFPHHENEVAQSRAATGKLLARYWIHGEMLFVEGRKMSKSLGNLVILDEIRERGFEPLDLRYLFLQAHYRSKQNFTWEALKGAAAARQKLQRVYGEAAEGEPGELEEFQARLGDDLDTPRALAYVWERVNGGASRGFLREVEKVLDLGLGEELDIPGEIQQLLQQREGERRKGDFETADALRDRIQGLGFQVDDTPEGPRVGRRLD